MKLSKAVVLVILCAAPALAWTGLDARMDVPFAFAVQGKVLPAGVYYVHAPNASGIASLENAAGRKSFFLPRPGKTDPAAKGYALFQPTAAGYVLAEVLLPGSDTAHRVPGVKTLAKPVQIALAAR